MTTRAKACVGYWAAHDINRDGGGSVACDALGRIIRCKTKKLALSIACYRRRRLQPLRGGSANLANTEMRQGKEVRARRRQSEHNDRRSAGPGAAVDGNEP